MTRHKDPKQSDRNVLLFNVLSDIRIVLNEARKQFTEVEELHSELSEGIMVASTMTNEVGLAIVSLFHEVPLLNQMIECRGDYMGLTCGSDSLLYFLGKLADVLSPQYKLIEEDILRVRIKTTGILEVRAPGWWTSKRDVTYSLHTFQRPHLHGKKNCFYCVMLVVREVREESGFTVSDLWLQ
eukprot:TRINITY_DN5595_c0_g3_i6.p1 TRINITY_DN5595_c0_g3~~TRINITY_DN5595_c0_g3_i6.p1  ORF type:complete len:183 (-),score=18.51 TRINITY_DN5595_c0_g3_i6:688-1236(-)